MDPYFAIFLRGKRAYTINCLVNDTSSGDSYLKSHTVHHIHFILRRMFRCKSSVSKMFRWKKLPLRKLYADQTFVFKEGNYFCCRYFLLVLRFRFNEFKTSIRIAFLDILIVFSRAKRAFRFKNAKRLTTGSFA